MYSLQLFDGYKSFSAIFFEISEESIYMRESVRFIDHSLQECLSNVRYLVAF